MKKNKDKKAKIECYNNAIRRKTKKKGESKNTQIRNEKNRMPKDGEVTKQKRAQSD